MKKLIFSFVALFSMLFLYTNCSQEDSEGPDTRQTEISFSFDIGNNASKSILQTDYENENGCIDWDTLKQLAASHKLTATLVFRNGDTITTRINYLNNGTLVTDATMMRLGKHYLEAAVITDHLGEVLFSGVRPGSTFANMVPDSELMGNKCIELTEEHLFKKTTFGLWVLCAYHIEASEFGFIKWELNPVVVTYLPFMVNVCTEAGDISGSGHIRIEYKDADGSFIILRDTDFTSDGKINNLCFIDRYQRPDEEEIHRFTLTLTGEAARTALISLSELKQYRKQNEWIAEYNFLHFNFCTCNTWFFKCNNE
ncbi:MAG: hypothetical protein RR346_11620 [Bacteroidales bacterium]